MTSATSDAAAATGARHAKHRRHAATSRGVSALMYASQQGDVDRVRKIVREQSAALLTRDRTGKTPLHYCCTSDNICAAQAADLLVMAAPDLVETRDEDGFTPLHLAVIAGNMPLVTFLLANKADVGAVDNEKHTVVHWATVCGETAALRAVLAAGAPVSTPDVHGGYPLHYAAQMCGGEKDSGLGQQVLQTLLTHSDINVAVEDGDGRQPLLWAASAGSAKAVLALIRAGAGVEAPDKDGLTALHCAASRGHTDCIDTLLTLCGASPDVIDTNGCTALHYAVTLGHADATALLLAHGADPNRQDRKGRTPAHCGCAKGQFETVKIIGAHGANLWLKNARGDFPLHEAAASGRRDLVGWLLETRPSQVNARNNDGRCPLHLAALNDNADMCKILLDAGAQVNPILRTSKNTFMTPLDCALQRGFRSTAKYLQLHGGVPATRLGDVRQNQIMPPLNLQIKEDVAFWGDTSSDSENGESAKHKKIQKKKLSHKAEKKKASLSPSEEHDKKVDSEKNGKKRFSGRIQKKTGDRSDSTDFSKHEKKIPSNRVDYTNEIVINGKTEINIHNSKQINFGEDETAKLPTKSEIEQTVFHDVTIEKDKRPKSAKARDKSAKSEKNDTGKQKTKVERPNSKNKQGTIEQSNQNEELAKSAAESVVGVSVSEPRDDGHSELNVSLKEKLQDQQSVMSNTSEEVEEQKKLVVEAAVHEPPKSLEEKEIQTVEAEKVDKMSETDKIVEEKRADEKLDSDHLSQEKDLDKNAEDNNSEQKVQDEPKESIAEKPEELVPEGTKQEVVSNEHSSETEEKQTEAEELTKTKIEEEERDLVPQDEPDGKKTGTEKEEGDIVSHEEPDGKKSATEKEEVAEKDEDNANLLGEPDGKTEHIVDHDQGNSNGASDNNIKTKSTADDQEQNNEEIGGKSETKLTADDQGQSNGTTDDKTETKVDAKIHEEHLEVKKHTGEEDKNGTLSNKASDHTLQTEQESVSKIVAAEHNIDEDKDIKTVPEIESIEASTKDQEATQKQIEENKGDPNLIIAQNKESKQRKSKKKQTKSEAKKSKEPEENGGVKGSDDTEHKDGNKNKTVQNEKSKKEKSNRKIHRKNQQVAETQAYEIIYQTLGAEDVNDELKIKEDAKSSSEEESSDLESESSNSTNLTVKEHKSFRILDEKEAEDIKSKKSKGRKTKSPLRKQRSHSEENKTKETDKIRKSKIPLRKSPLSKSDKYLHVPDRKAKSSMESRVPSLPNIHKGFKEPPRPESNMSAPLLPSMYSDNEELTPSDLEQEEEEEKKTSATRKKKVKRRAKPREAKSAGSDYESSNVIDSGFEPSPRSTRIPKWKNMSDRGVNMTSVTQSIQNNIRRYHLERKIFQHLLDLKRMQIRAGQHNEAILVKRAIDSYHQSCASTVGAGRYVPEDYTFKSFEKFLYLSLRKLQRNGADHLRGLPETPANPLLCTQSTHRCMHATHAYTGIPCAAYLPKMDHHTVPKVGFSSTQCKPGTGFLPTINQKKAVTLELCHGNDKQVISLPADRLDQNKRYYVTFTVKGSENTPPNEEVTGHRHSKSD